MQPRALESFTEVGEHLAPGVRPSRGAHGDVARDAGPLMERDVRLLEPRAGLRRERLEAPPEDRCPDRVYEIPSERRHGLGRWPRRLEPDERHVGAGQLGIVQDRRRMGRILQLAPHLPGDPEQQQAARQHQADDREQLHRDHRERDPAEHRQPDADHDHPPALLRRQAARRQADHDRIVAGQHEVDHDHGEEGVELGKRKLHQRRTGIIPS